MVLEGIKVIELADGFAGPFCGLQFADAGADVIKIERPEGDRTRSIGPFTNGISHVFLSLNRGKKGVVLDFRTKEGREAARKLFDSADVVITHFPPGVARELKLDYDSFKETNPGLIYGSISDLGSAGSLKGRRGSELTAQALSGIWRFLGDMSTPEARAGLVEPYRVGAYIGSSWAGIFLFQGTVSALLCRRKLGFGQKVETSLLGSIIAVQSQNWAVMTKPDKWYGFELIGPMAIPAQGILVKDGAINVVLARGNPEKVAAFWKEVGIDPKDSRFGYRFSMPHTIYDRPDLELHNKAFTKYTREEACKLIHEDLEAWGAPYNEYSECMTHPQTKHMGIVVNVDHPKGGKYNTFRSPWVLTGTPWKPAGRPPLLGEHTDGVLKGGGFSDEAISNIKEAKPEFERIEVQTAEEVSEPIGALPEGPGPLQGIKVVDFAGMAVGPWAGSLLGLLGAHVIKIDPTFGDGILLREPTQNGINMPYLAFNQGKWQAIGLDLKNPEDKEVAMAMVKEADVLIENFRPGVMERLGFGYKTLSEMNPRLVYGSASGFGQTGPIAHWASTDSSAAQPFTGYAALNGPRGGRPESLRFASTNDLSTSMALASGVILGLFAREMTGKGQWMQTSMLEACTFIQTSRYAEYFSTGMNPPRMASALPNIVPDQAFRTHDGYVAVSATNQEEWENLCKALELPQLISDSKFATNEDRVKNREELVKKLEEKFETLPTWWWFSHLGKNNVPCAPYLTLEDVIRHDHHRENKFIVELDIPIAGKVNLAGPPFQFSRTPAKIVRPALGVQPKEDRWMRYGLIERYPNGYSGEHTALLKERFRKKQPMFISS